ncbi:MAG: type II toxin-antitoxin system VapC family toxin [Gemmatimonadota bacterium]
MPVKVVDASALAAILFGERSAATVSKQLEDGIAVAPTLLRYELASVCLKKIRRHPERKEALLQALSLFPRLALEEVEVPPTELTTLADRVGLSVYDAAYLWLARSLNAEVVTLDTDLRAATET